MNPETEQKITPGRIKARLRAAHFIPELVHPMYEHTTGQRKLSRKMILEIEERSGIAFVSEPEEIAFRQKLGHAIGVTSFSAARKNVIRREASRRMAGPVHGRTKRQLAEAILFTTQTKPENQTKIRK